MRRSPRYRIRTYSADFMGRTNWFAVVHCKRWSWRKIGHTQQGTSEADVLGKASAYLADNFHHGVWDEGSVDA